MAVNCDGLFKGSPYDCDNPPQAGVNPRLILINFEDIDSFTQDGDGVITNIVLKANTQAYAFQNFRNSLKPEHHLVVSDFSVAWDHQINFFVFEVTQLQKNNLERMASVRTVGIVQNSNSTVEVYGIRVGMDVITNDRLVADQATAGVYQVQIKTPDNDAKESKLPQTLLVSGTFEATIDFLDDLIVLPIIYNVSPITGVIAGGDNFTISGDNLTGATQVDWVDSLDAVTNEPSYTVDNDEQISITGSVAKIAGTYKLRVTTPAGVAESELVIVIS